jgi:hypothetical protein
MKLQRPKVHLPRLKLVILSLFEESKETSVKYLFIYALLTPMSSEGDCFETDTSHFFKNMMEIHDPPITG